MESIEFISKKKWCLIIFWSCDWKTLFFLYVNVVFGLGLHQFIFNFCISKFLEITVKRLYNPERNIWRRYWRLPPWLCCESVCPRWCACGGRGARMRRHVIWWHLQALPMQQCGWHCGSLHHIVSFFCFFCLENVISSLAASLHMGSLHPAVVFIIYCCFLVPFCSSGCTWPP